MSTQDTDLAHLHRALADHARREQPLANALQVVSEELEDKALRAAVLRMQHALMTGASIGEAWAEGTPEIPSLYGALLESASGSGDVATALDQIAEHANRSASVTQRLRRALSAPIVTAIVCIAFGSIAFVMAGPQIMKLGDTITGVSPVPYASIGIGLLVLFVIAAFVATRMRSTLARGSLGVPVLGPLRLDAVRADLAANLGLMLRRGVSLPEAMTLAASATPEGTARDAVTRMADHARTGASVTETLQSESLYSQSTLWLVGSADGTDGLTSALDDLSDIHRRRLERGIDRMAVLTRPIAEVVVGVAVFFLAYSYVGPMADMLDRLMSF